MKQLPAIFMAVALMMFGLTNVASADHGGVCGNQLGVALVDMDGTPVGVVDFVCTTNSINVEVVADEGFVLLETIADLVSVGAAGKCDRAGYVNPAGNPRMGTGDASESAEFTRGSRVIGNVMPISIQGTGETAYKCVVVEVFLFNDGKVEGFPKRLNAYNFGFDLDFDGPSPHMYRTFKMGFGNPH